MKWLRVAGMIALVVLAGYSIWQQPSPQNARSFEYLFGLYDAESLARNLFLTYLLACLVHVALSKARPSLSLARLGILTGTLLIAVGLIELPALTGAFDYREIFYPRIPGSLGPHNRVYQPGIAYSRPPHDEFESHQLGGAVIQYDLEGHPRYSARHHYDARGYRNRVDLDRADIVLIGDSFVEGTRVTQAEILSELLAERVAVPVANFGQSDYGPTHELRVLRKLALDLRPRIVVWFFYEGNDIVYLTNYAERLALTIQYEERFERRSFVLNALRFAIRATTLATRESRGDRRWGSWVDADGREVRIYFAMPPALPSADRQKTLEQVQLVLRRARRDANQAGAHFLLAFVPTKLRVLRGLMTIPSNSDLVSRRPLDDLPEQLGVWARQHDIPYLDLTPTLISAAQSGELVYLADDGHWSASGHRVVAERVGAALEPWLDSDSSP